MITTIGTDPVSFATLVVTKPVTVGIGIAALALIFLAFKAAKFVMKMLLLLAALAALGLAAWWYYAAHHA